ncbi:hypothetical protein BMS3Bbin02_00012 [bacterium BMS3Bbin02]|nr:hypothetical protein BMS3Bbin02_00012 [bacterium BMS3Bbin02]
MTAGAIGVEAFITRFPKCNEKWQALAAAKAEAEGADDLAKLANAKFRKAEWELIDQMLDDDVQGVPDKSGSFASTSRQWTIACNQENKNEVETFLVDTFGDAEVFKTFVLDKSAIRAKLRKECENEESDIVEDELPEFFKLNTRSQLRIKDWEKKKGAIA